MTVAVLDANVLYIPSLRDLLMWLAAADVSLKPTLLKPA
jgi:hypothetical protein